MQVKDIMTAAPESCRPEDNLAKAVELLWKGDCGALPVVDDIGRVAGILTDRDICVALGTRDVRASEVPVASVMRPTVHTCEPASDALAALAQMAALRVRRLPVVDPDGRLAGILSLNDFVLAAGGGRHAVRSAAVLDALQAICAHSLPAERPYPSIALDAAAYAATSAVVPA